jgi:hypothetical protein
MAGTAVVVAELEVFGVRHHGPGSARSVRRALDDFQPDIVLVELAADCQQALQWIGDIDLQPPVALLGYVVAAPHRALFSPFAEFSPEWQAFRWAQRNGVEMRAIDLPLCNTLAPPVDGAGDELLLSARAPVDPIAELARAGGDLDPERWWDDVIEHRGDGREAFTAVAEAMAAVRGTVAAGDLRELRREAHMRQCIRRAWADGFARIAVICGAWHVPALAGEFPAAAVDAKVLRGLSKVKVGVSWVPWTHRRLAASSGYGAGVSSPGWYAHVFANPGPEGITRWFVDAARLLRSRDMPASPDHLIAGIRSAEALAALRDRPRPGLAEVLDAADAVMAGTSGLALIREQLVIGDVIGSVPDNAPQVPLARDVAAQHRAARLKPEAAARMLELDLRTPAGRARSVLLHRLSALGVPWGVVEEGRGSSGTFRETWNLRWDPELSIRLIELAGHGTTLQQAAVSVLTERLRRADVLADLVGVLDTALLSELPEVVQPCVRRLGDQAATAPDVAQLIDTLGPLSRSLRYGDVRGTDAASLRGVFDGLVVRVIAGVPTACRSLDDDAAAAMVERLAAVQAALAMCDHPARHEQWPAVLTVLSERADVHGRVQGRAVRLAHDNGTWAPERVQRRLGRALSVGTPPATGAAFVEGFLAGSGTVLVHDNELLEVVDDWVSSLSHDAFSATTPLLRRTFGAFDVAERRQLGLLVSDQATATTLFGEGVDERRAAAALATVRDLLGVAR